MEDLIERMKIFSSKDGEGMDCAVDEGHNKPV